MQRTFGIFLVILYSGVLSAQNFSSLSFGTDSTFDIATWNIEHFPKSSSTANYVKDIIESYNLDLIAIQELDDTVEFKQFIDEFPGYSGYFKSGYFAGLAYIYKTNVIKVNDIYEIYTTSKYWNAFPRSPMVMEMRYGFDTLIVINNHFKCCGDGILNESDEKDEENRRLEAGKLLKDFINFQKPTKKVILLGDLNDEITDAVANNVFQDFIDDTDEFSFVDMDVAEGDAENWSFPSWPSHLDHILVTNEIFSNSNLEILDVQALQPDEVFLSWNDYDSKVTDHRPVAMKLHIKGAPHYSAVSQNFRRVNFSNYPNPFTNYTTFSFSELDHVTAIDIYTVSGVKVLTKEMSKGAKTFVWDATQFPAGIYYAVLKSTTSQLKSIKLVHQ